MNENLTSLGFDPKPYPRGVHLCYIFSDDDERRRIVAKFIQSGLDARERVGYFVDSTTPEDFRLRLAQLGVCIPQDAPPDPLQIASAQSIYCPDGSFKVDRMLQTIERAQKDSRADGFDGLRVSGEMGWALRGIPGSENLIEYESQVNRVLKREAVTAICQYDARRFDGATLYKLLRVHPMMIVRGQIVRNPYYVQSD